LIIGTEVAYNNDKGKNNKQKQTEKIKPREKFDFQRYYFIKFRILFSTKVTRYIKKQGNMLHLKEKINQQKLPVKT
jgi:hypothetical protein